MDDGNWFRSPPVLRLLCFRSGSLVIHCFLGLDDGVGAHLLPPVM